MFTLVLAVNIAIFGKNTYKLAVLCLQMAASVV
jgi:hypothetical protein